MAHDKKEQGEKVVATNRKAFHDYAIAEKLEAGIALWGTEVKALREGLAARWRWRCKGGGARSRAARRVARTTAATSASARTAGTTTWRGAWGARVRARAGGPNVRSMAYASEGMRT